MKPIIHKCTLQDSTTGVFLQEIAPSDVDFQKSDVTFTWGKTPDEILTVYELGKDSLSIIVNPENEQSSLTLEQLTAILNGEITQWKQVGSSISGDIAWWMVPSGDEGLDILVIATGVQPLRNPFAWIAPDAEAVRQAVAENPSAMGFIPTRWLNENVKSISLDGIEETTLTKPILAITRQQPEPQLTNFLQCLQSEIEK
jgi:ABC-type phosphate transport system substrate-binding protein